MSEPKYDEDLVNLGYLKRVISDTEEGINIDFKNVSRHYGSQPIPPYYEGDTWVDGNIVYTCINTRLVGSYTAADWTTESGALQKAESKNRVFLTQPSNYKPGDMWILQSDNDHRAGTKGEILISTAGRAVYDSDDWINMLGYGTIRSINEVAGNLNNAITRIGVVEEAIEDGLIITFYQASVPEGVHIGDLWYVTGTVTGYTQGKIYRYNGSTWDLLNDPAIQQAFTEANNARLVADGKIQSFYSASEPTTGDIGVGDLWIDTDDNNKLYRYNGTNWVACYDTRIDGMVETVEETTERVTSIETDLGEIDLTVSETTTRVTTLEGAVDNIKDTTGQAEGKYIHLDDSSDDTITSAKFNGETSQATRSGKNIFNKDATALGSNATKTVLNTGVRATSNVAGTFKYFSIEIGKSELLGKTLIISSTMTASSNNNGRICLFYGNSNNPVTTNAEAILDSSGSLKKTLLSTFPQNCDTVYALIYSNRSGTGNVGDYVDYTNLQIEIGSQATSYEPYGVMPSPDYPSEIENLEGRNKFDKDTANILNAYLSGGKVITSSANDRTIYIPCKANTTYTLSKMVQQTTANNRLALAYSSNLPTLGGSFTERVFLANGTTQTSLSITTDSNAKYLLAYIYYQDTNTTFEEILDSIQIEEGTVATPYAPYNSLEVKATNKNIFDEILENGGFDTNGINGPNAARIRSKNYIPIKENTSHIISVGENNTGKTLQVSMSFYNTNDYVTPRISHITWTTITNGVIFTTPANCKYMRFLISYTDGSNITINDNLGEIMIEKGETKTDYEEHQEQTVYFPLAEGQKLYEGSYFADDGIHNVKGQVVLDGTENWYFTSNCVYTNAIKDLVKKTPNNQVANILCDYYLKDSLANCYNNVNDKRISINNQGYMYIYDTTYTSANSFKTWLLNNPITVEYELAEEEIIPYNTEQQAAWNSIKSLHTYKTVTHIYSDAYAEIGYIKDNGLDIYETKHEASRKYIETTEKFAQQKITNESIENTVSQTVTTVANNYNELKTKFDDYAPKSDVITLQTSVNQIMTDTYTKTEINEKLTDGSVTKVSTTAGTFDSNGLTIEKTDAKTKGNFNHEGIKVMDTTSGSNQELLFAGYDEEINETIVRTNNLTVNKYFTLKNVSRQEKYVNPVLGGKGIGTFIL